MDGKGWRAEGVSFDQRVAGKMQTKTSHLGEKRCLTLPGSPSTLYLLPLPHNPAPSTFLILNPPPPIGFQPPPFTFRPPSPPSTYHPPSSTLHQPPTSTPHLPRPFFIYHHPPTILHSPPATLHKPPTTFHINVYICQGGLLICQERLVAWRAGERAVNSPKCIACK